MWFCNVRAFLMVKSYFHCRVFEIRRLPARREKLNNKLCKPDWTVLREKILPLGFSLLITHIAMAQRSLFDFGVSKTNKLQSRQGKPEEIGGTP